MSVILQSRYALLGVSAGQVLHLTYKIQYESVHTNLKRRVSDEARKSDQGYIEHSAEKTLHIPHICGVPPCAVHRYSSSKHINRSGSNAN